MESKIIPFVIISLATAFIVLGVLGAEKFMDSDVIVNSDHRSWTTTNGFTLKQLLGLIGMTYLIPLGTILLLAAIPKIYKSSINSLIRLFLLLTVESLLIICAVLAKKYYGKSLIDCGIFCFYADDDGSVSGKYEFVIVTGIIYFCIALSLAIIILPLIIGLIYSSIFKHSNNTDAASSKALVNRYVFLSPSSSVDRTSNIYDGLFVFICFVCFYPFMIFCCMTLPNFWENYSISSIQRYELLSMRNVGGKSTGKVWVWEYSDFLKLKLWPDVLAFYLFIYVITAVGLLTRAVPSIRSFMHKRYVCFRGFRIGEILLILLFIGLILGEAYYWYYYRPAWNGSYRSDLSKAEVRARSMGELQNCVLGLLILPVSRNSVWSTVFGVSWESAIKFHRWLGYIFLIFVILHVAFWWQVYGQYNSFPHDIYALDRVYISDDFTINLIFVVSCTMFVAMGILAYEKVRRAYFELFYYSHHVFVAIFIAVLWHANSSWYYILAGLVLWFFDRIIRFEKGCSIVKVTEIEPIDGSVVKLSYVIENGGKGTWGGNLEPLHHKMGQYVFINIPEISWLEWHPFSISSSQFDDATTHHIRNMGPNTFTDKLFDLASDYSSTNCDLLVNVDGPYGFPIEYERYRRIIFIAGGIGITPCHSYFKSLYHLKKQHKIDGLDMVQLVWVSTHPSKFNLFKDTFEEVNANSLNGAFSIRLYSSWREAGKSNCTVPFKDGRPPIQEIIADLSPFGMTGLVFVCGPSSLTNECDTLSNEFQVDFHAETFEI